MCLVFTVLFQVSLAYVTIGMTRVLKRFNLLLSVIEFDRHILSNLLNAPCPFPILHVMFFSILPSISILLPRYVKFLTVSSSVPSIIIIGVFEV